VLAPVAFFFRPGSLPPFDRGAAAVGEAGWTLRCAGADRLAPLLGGPTQIVDPRGTTTNITRDGSGQATAVVRGAGSPAESSTQITYNKRGQVEKVTNPNGHVTHYEYFDTEGDKSYGYLQNVTVDDGGLNLKTRYEVDQRGNVIRLIDPRGNSHERTWNEVDWLTGASEPLGYETQYQYDAAGNMTQQDLPFGDGEETTRTRVTYGKLGEVLTTDRDITPAGEVAHDEYTYDADLNVLTHIAPEHQTTRWTYDERNLPVQVVHGTNLSTESMEYDQEGRLTAWTDGRSSVWHTSYDGYGRATETLDPLGNKSAVTYDDGSNVTERKAFETGDLLLADEETVYDALGRPTIQRRKLFANGGGATDNVETQLQYDKIGHVTQVTDPLQRVSLMTYDGAERLNGQTDAAGNVSVMELDENGNAIRSLVSERNAQGGVVPVEHTATYDELNPARQAAPSSNASAPPGSLPTDSGGRSAEARTHWPG
jgi:YD repeat-containing protein